MIVTNAFSEPLTGGSVNDPDFDLQVTLSADGNQGDPSDIDVPYVVKVSDAHKMYSGIGAGESVVMLVTGTCD